MTEPVNALVNGVKLVGETILPGTSLLMEGKVLNGAAHAVIGLGARALLGPAGLLLVCADSFSKSATDKYLWDHVAGALRSTKSETPVVIDHAPAVTPPAAPPATPAAPAAKSAH